jgi:DNA-binding CsgD family transcriptional regulator
MLTVWFANRWDDASRAEIARRWIAGETQWQIGESLDTTASAICQQIMHFCNDWSKEVRGNYYGADRRKVALVALRNYFFASDELPKPPLPPRSVWKHYDRETINDADYAEARREHMFLLRAEGITYRAIGKRFGITGGRAAQIIARYSLRVRRAMHDTRFRWEKTPPGPKRHNPAGLTERAECTESSAGQSNRPG